MSKDLKGNTLQYMSNNCMLVINQQGKIRELFTPFLVTTSNDNVDTKKTFVVEQVLNNSNGQLIYVINGNNYPYNQFRITINF